MTERSTVYDMLRAWGADFLASLAFLTRLPLLGALPHAPLARAMRAFPLAGAAIGLAGGLLLVALHGLGLSNLAAAAICLAGLALLTGGLHEDGLADVADGFGGGRDRARKLEIMRDSRIGTYGVLAVALILVIRAACLADLSGGPVWWTAVCIMSGAGAFSRALVAWLLASTTPARSNGLSSGVGQLAEGVLAIALVTGGIGALVLFYLAAGVSGALVSLATGFAAAALVRMLAVRQIGGHTGDVCGTLVIVCETAMLAAASIFS